MRIIGGKLKGKKLHSPKDNSVRPTSDRLRESLFNILIHRGSGMDGIHMMDVFAGTGAMGLEALSRGARHVTFVEKHPKLLQTNVAACNLERKQYDIISGDILTLLAANKQQQASINLVFMDAPFAQAEYLTLAAIERVETGAWLASDVLIITEIPQNLQLELSPKWQIIREIKAAASKILMIERLL